MAEDIGKSHTHVLNMERVHRKYGGKPHVRTLSAWNKLYKGPAAAQPINWPKKRLSIAIRTPAGYLAEAEQAVRSAVRENGAVKVARKMIKVVGEDNIRRALVPQGELEYDGATWREVDPDPEDHDPVEPDEVPDLEDAP